MKTKIFLLSLVCALSACGDPDPAKNSADEFAARIGGSGAANADASPADAGTPPTTGDEPRAIITPEVAKPLPSANDEVAATIAADPAATNCGANRMGPFIGLVADVRTRIDIEDAVGSGREIRFVRPGGAYIEPDESSPRLNLILDIQDVIRDARCG